MREKEKNIGKEKRKEWEWKWPIIEWKNISNEKMCIWKKRMKLLKDGKEECMRKWMKEKKENIEKRGRGKRKKGMKRNNYRRIISNEEICLWMKWMKMFKDGKEAFVLE